MPRLCKGGKWVFGWVVVGGRREIMLPPEACGEYLLLPKTEVAFTRGSRTSGGFGIGRLSVIRGNEWVGGRILARGDVEEGGLVTLPPEVDACPGARLLAVRGSGLALGFLRRGRIFEAALGHPEIEVFVA